ncbi:hypothetical protein R3P38DRAFT_3522652 [Favolaschia claudopus]|uniref:Uncharacterized protein n=1 Tax=Favolaschia claudopus TaxID=2862362 RepID=A0AAW0E2E8_9AGAR
MKTNTNKLCTPQRFSPVSPLPRRHASNIGSEKTAMLFASEPVNGQGALSSQITDTQFFGQYDRSPSPSPKTTKPSPLSPPLTPSQYVETQPRDIENDVFSDADSEPDSNSDDWAVISPPSFTPNPPPSTACDVLVKHEDNGDDAGETTVKQEEEDVPLEPLPDLTFSELSDFEKWVICRMRETVKDGVRLSTRLQNLKKRCDYMEDMYHHHKRILAEIHSLSRNLF